MDGERALRRLRAFRPRDLAHITSGEFYQTVIQCFADFCQVRQGAFYVVSARGGRLELRASINLPDRWLVYCREAPISSGPGSGSCGRAAAERRVVVSEDLSEKAWDGLRHHARSAGIGSSWAVPLFDSEDEVIAVFCAFDAAPGAPSERQLAHAKRIAREAADVIEMATLYYGQEGLLKLHRRTQELAHKLVVHSSPESVFDAIAGAVKELLSADLVWANYVTHDGKVHFFQSEEFFDIPTLLLPDSPCRIAYMSNQVVELHRSSSSLLERMGLGSVLCQPMVLDEGKAVISAGWRHERHTIERERISIDLYTKFGAVALQNAMRYEALRSSYYAMMRGYLTALEARDFETIAHSRRVVTYSMLLAEHLGFQDPEMKQIALGAALHDVGKIGIPDRILHKPDKLTPEEFEIVRSHPLIGFRMLESAFAQFPVALDLVLHHHERYDGKGYPDGIAGTEISLEARILAVADAFDVMTTDRPYKKGKPVADALQEVAALSGSQFCPQVCRALLSLDVGLLEAVQRGEVDCSPFPTLFDPQPVPPRTHQL